MKNTLFVLGLWLAISAGQMALAAEISSASRFDAAIQSNVARVTTKKEFINVQAAVEDGIVTLTGDVDLYQQKLDATKKVRKVANEFDRDSALWLVDNTAGVKDVIDNIKVAPTSIFDDRLRISALRAIYRDPVLSRYGIDPAKPIRIVVDHGHLSLYGTVASPLDKQVAGIRASQVFGAFTVQNNLQVEKKS